MEKLKKKDVKGLVTNNDFNTKIGEFGNKIPCVSGLVTNTVLNIKIGKLEKKFLIMLNLLPLLNLINFIVKYKMQN